MNPERWRQIEDLYHAAAARSPEQRAPFLAASCGADEDLRRRVELLLAQANSDGQIFRQPAGDLLEDSTMTQVAAGRLVGPYQIEGLLGAGGMGTVYRARDTRLGRAVALKFLAGSDIADGPGRERFQREAQALSALNHPNVCTMYDLGEDRGHPFLVIELLDGQTLKQRLAAGRCSNDELLSIAIPVSEGLEAAHALDIVHRDIKPANIFLTQKGVPKILDFGLAKSAARGKAGTAISYSGPLSNETLTTPGTTIGTVSYMSPEQVRGEVVDTRTDLFSFGVVLYEMATGSMPFRGETAGMVFESILNRAPIPAGRLNPGVPADLERIIGKCLEKDCSLRYQNASEIRTGLQRLKRGWESGQVIASREPPAAKGIARRWKAIVPAAAGVLALFAAGYFYFHRTPKLTDKDTIVLADFTNTTGDSVFDGTLRQGLAVQLEQSPFLSLVSDQRIQRTLSLMGRPADARLTPELGREICERTASAAVLDGSIASLGSQYVLGLRAKNCRTGDVLDEEQVQAARKEDVLNALSQIASKFRSRVGESLSTIEKLSTPLEEATTPSLEALKAYSAAWKVHASSGDAAALSLFKRAVEIDPKFAMAHAFLGRTYGDIGESNLSAESTTKAYQLRDRTSDREKFFITATYDQQVTGNLQKAQETFELWAQTYPREIQPHGLLSGQIYPVFGQHEKAIEEAKKAIAIDPDVIFPYADLATSYQFLDRFGDAEATYRLAAERKVEFPDLVVQRYDLAFLRGDQAEMDKAVALCQGRPGAEDAISAHEALVLAYSGHLQEARRMSGRAADMAQQAGDRERAALFKTGATLWDALFENVPAARRGAMAVLEVSKGRDVEYGAALALALSGDSSGAETLANDLAKRFPEDTSVQISYLPELRALLAMNRGEPAKAIELLQVSVPYELGVPLSWFSGSFGVLYPAYVRGEAHLAAHQGAEAAAEFQKILDHRGLVASDPIGALAHLQLGRALVLSGDRAKAKAAYQDFLTLWKGADPDIPILKQAQAESAKIR